MLHYNTFRVVIRSSTSSTKRTPRKAWITPTPLGCHKPQYQVHRNHTQQHEQGRTSYKRAVRRTGNTVPDYSLGGGVAEGGGSRKRKNQIRVEMTVRTEAGCTGCFFRVFFPDPLDHITAILVKTPIPPQGASRGQQYVIYFGYCPARVQLCHPIQPDVSPRQT